MTEREAIKGLWFFKNKLHNGIFGDRLECIDVAIKALEEIQQYREIGTVEECRTAINIIKEIEEAENEELEELAETIDEYIEELEKKIEKYKAIGTVEECRAAMEKQKPRKPVKRSFIIPYEGIDVCPNCKEPINKKEHHCKCGQAIDWS